MNSKSFMLTVVGVLVLGGMVGGAFVAGLVVGGGSEDEEAPNVLTLPSPGGSGAASGDIQGLGAVLQRAQAGEITQEEIAQLRQQFGRGDLGGQGGGFAAGLAGGGGVLFGTVESVDGGRITVNTAQGPLEATIGPETVIQRTEIAVLTADELREGVQVQVFGEPNEAGVVSAAAIIVVPEGAGGFGGFGGRGFGGRGPGLGAGQ